MPRNGSGTYTLPQTAFVPGTTISSAAVNSDFSDIAAALTQSLSADGQTPITGQLKFPNGTPAAPSITFGTDLTTGLYYPGTNQLGFSTGGTGQILINGNNVGSGQNGQIFSYANGAAINPVGSVISYAGSTAPSGWQLCFGQAISRTSYPELFQVIGTIYGNGDGSTTFNLPDCRGRAPFGKDNMGGTPAGRISTGGGTFDGTVLGGNGGSQNSTLTVQANLPNCTFANSGITVANNGNTGISVSGSGTLPATGNISIAGPGSSPGTSFLLTNANTINNFNLVSGGPNLQITANVSISSQGNSQVSVSGQGSAASGGSSQAFPTLSPAIIFNTIIFAGRP